MTDQRNDNSRTDQGGEGWVIQQPGGLVYIRCLYEVPSESLGHCDSCGQRQADSKALPQFGQISGKGTIVEGEDPDEGDPESKDVGVGVDGPENGGHGIGKEPKKQLVATR